MARTKKKEVRPRSNVIPFKPARKARAALKSKERAEYSEYLARESIEGNPYLGHGCYVNAPSGIDKMRLVSAIAEGKKLLPSNGPGYSPRTFGLLVAGIYVSCETAFSEAATEIEAAESERRSRMARWGPRLMEIDPEALYRRTRKDLVGAPGAAECDIEVLTRAVEEAKGAASVDGWNWSAWKFGAQTVSRYLHLLMATDGIEGGPAAS